MGNEIPTLWVGRSGRVLEPGISPDDKEYYSVFLWMKACCRYEHRTVHRDFWEAVTDARRKHEYLSCPTKQSVLVMLDPADALPGSFPSLFDLKEYIEKRRRQHDGSKLHHTSEHLPSVGHQHYRKSVFWFYSLDKLTTPLLAF